MPKHYTERTETTYEVVTNFGQVVQITHNPSVKTVGLALIHANGEIAGEIEFTVRHAAEALAEIFGDLVTNQEIYEDDNR
jgi:hypothetical protein